MWDNAIEQNNQNTMSDTVTKYNKNTLQFQISVTAEGHNDRRRALSLS